MLVITHQTPSDIKYSLPSLETEWHVGDKKLTIPAENVVEIFADCDELDLIESIFKATIPISSGKSCKWYGDIARTIYINLLRSY